MTAVGLFQLSYSVLFKFLPFWFAWFSVSVREVFSPHAGLQLDPLQRQRLASPVRIPLVEGQNYFLQRLRLGEVPITTVFPESTIRFFFSCLHFFGSGRFFFSCVEAPSQRSTRSFQLCCVGAWDEPKGRLVPMRWHGSAVGFEARFGLQ